MGLQARIHAATARAIRVMVLPDEGNSGQGAGAIGGGAVAGSRGAPFSESGGALPVEYLDVEQRQMVAVLRMLGDAFPEGRDGGQLAALRGGAV